MPSQFSALKYSVSSKKEEEVPFNLTFWGSEEGATLEVEFNPNQTLLPSFSDLAIFLPCSCPSVQSVENSEFEETGAGLLWKVGRLDGVHS